MKKFLCMIIILLFASSSFAAGKIDIDLTKFSDVMLYSGVFNILSNPEAYTGKIIKVSGSFDYVHEQDTGRYFFAVIITDAAACCSIGFDFVLKDSYKYPQDYPKKGDKITVTGRFERYKDGEDMFCNLVNADYVK
ncbi:MAG: hypothetical protein IJS99_05720 [Synergistaceae bacterium]|nr:hypothetical protein [Synergistaceae bacterium]